MCFLKGGSIPCCVGFCVTRLQLLRALLNLVCLHCQRTIRSSPPGSPARRSQRSRSWGSPNTSDGETLAEVGDDIHEVPAPLAEGAGKPIRIEARAAARSLTPCLAATRFSCWSGQAFAAPRTLSHPLHRVAMMPSVRARTSGVAKHMARAS